MCEKGSFNIQFVHVAAKKIRQKQEGNKKCAFWMRLYARLDDLICNLGKINKKNEWREILDGERKLNVCWLKNKESLTIISWNVCSNKILKIKSNVK